MSYESALFLYGKCRDYYSDIEQAEELFQKIDKLLSEYPDFENKSFSELLKFVL